MRRKKNVGRMKARIIRRFSKRTYEEVYTTRSGPSLQASLEVTVPDCGYYGLFRFREAVWKVDGVYQRDDCFRGNRTNPFLFNDHLPNYTYRKIITRPISLGSETASFSHMRHQRLPPSSPFAV